MDEQTINKLINNIKETNLNKSSHWKKHLPDGSDYLNQFEHLGFGMFTKKSVKNLIHNILAKIIFGNEVFKTKTYYAYKSIFDKIERYIDVDTIRHIFTFEKIKEHLNPKTICIIGDGKLNGVLGAHLTFPSANIYSVNLSEVLINDYIILDKINLDLKKSVELIDNINFINNNKILTLVPSNYKKFLLNKNIELFINIASFQEMTKNEINSYFEIIKNNQSKLYCCNREYKKLPDGEELYFDKYPFSNSRKIFWENCPWHQKFYSLRPPFIHNYGGNIKHCLVDFS
tara:strand:+ start:64 stop:924 length:861 start_codon:yes stop_codon:yes gene_type:complete